MENRIQLQQDQLNIIGVEIEALKRKYLKQYKQTKQSKRVQCEAEQIEIINQRCKEFNLNTEKVLKIFQIRTIKKDPK